MSVGRIAGAAAMGNLGWVRVRCKLCGTWILITKEEYYVCPNCEKRFNATFCAPCAKKIHYRCPYCRSELKFA